ncbi:hypothetical protein [Streptomyces sp. NPDC093589]|uniref:hypothetical protein n=1 Tax=Streptomyces sp. NPDC093589 TaxID=3366043 RepID=UPI003820B98B
MLDDVDKRHQAREAFDVIANAYRREGEAMARAWMWGMNPLLRDDSPLLTIAAGRGIAALRAARKHATGDDAH